MGKGPGTTQEGLGIMDTVTLDPQNYVESEATLSYGRPTSRQPNFLYILAGGGEIPITVELTKDGFLAVDSLVSVWGEGESPDVAIEDLLRTLHERFEDLSSHPGAMSSRMERQRDLLEHVFGAHSNG